MLNNTNDTNDDDDDNNNNKNNTRTGSSNSSNSNINNTKTNSKSRTGCAECKRKRVKCDEMRPVCTRCKKSRKAAVCDYNLKLSWTEGRPFKRLKIATSPISAAAIATAAAATADAADSSTQSSTTASSRHDARVLSEQDISSVALVTPDTSCRSAWDTPSAVAPYPVAVGPNSRDSTGVLFGKGIPPPQHSPSRFEDAPDNDDDNDTLDIAVDNPDGDGHPLDQVDGWVNSPLISDQVKQRAMSIPPSLSTYPILCPSESPNAYFYLHHYSVHTAITLFPLLPPASRDSLLSVASSNPSLLSALLAISAAQYGRLRGDADPEIANRAMFYSRKALTGLQKAMADPVEATTFPTISTVLALCTHDVLMSGHVQGWKTHLRGAEQLLTLKIGKSREAATVTDPVVLFLVKWFAAMDMFAGISSLEKSMVPDGRYWSIGESSTQQYVDDFVGFSLELMPILSRISRMARIQQRKSALAASLAAAAATGESSNSSSFDSNNNNNNNNNVVDDLDGLLADNVQHTEQQLTSLFSRVCSPSVADAFPTILAHEIQLTHRLFVYAALLHLYRRVQELPKTHPKPEHATSKIIEIIGMLRADSPASIVVLWPLFSAGCETDDAARRATIRARMLAMRRHGLGNVDQALRAMHEYWRSDTDERWDVFLGRLGVDLVLF